MSAEQVQLGLMIVVVALAAFALYRTYTRGETINVSGVVDELKAAVVPAAEIMGVVQMAVNSAEQMKREGKINTNDEAFNYVLDYVMRKIPSDWGITKEDVVMAINGAVLASSALARQAGVSSEK